MPFIVMFTLLSKNASTEIRAKQYEGVKRKLPFYDKKL